MVDYGSRRWLLLHLVSALYTLLLSPALLLAPERILSHWPISLLTLAHSHFHFLLPRRTRPRSG